METSKRKRSSDSADDAIDPGSSPTQQITTYGGSYDSVIRTVKRPRWTRDDEKAQEVIGGAGNLAAISTQHEPANTAAPGEVSGLWKSVNNVTRYAGQEHQERAREIASRDTYMGELEEAFDRQLDFGRGETHVEGSEAEGEAFDTDDEDDEDDQSDASQESEYCYCERPVDGLMVGCDGPECEREWFHLGCTSLETDPSDDESWFCEYCRPRVWQASLDLEDDCWRCPCCGWELFEDTDNTEEVVLPGKMPRVCHGCRAGCGDEYGEHTAYFEEVQKQEMEWNERFGQDGRESESPSSEGSEDSKGSDSLRSMIDDNSENSEDRDSLRSLVYEDSEDSEDSDSLRSIIDDEDPWSEDSEDSDSLSSMIDDDEEVDSMWCETQHSECSDVDCTECSDQEYHTEDTSSEESDSDDEANLDDHDDDEDKVKSETVEIGFFGLPILNLVWDAESD